MWAVQSVVLKDKMKAEKMAAQMVSWMAVMKVKL